MRSMHLRTRLVASVNANRHKSTPDQWPGHKTPARFASHIDFQQNFHQGVGESQVASQMTLFFTITYARLCADTLLRKTRGLALM